MYTDEDLKTAVDAGIFTAESVTKFRRKIASLKHSTGVKNEHFKLITGFNDIFVVIACIVLIYSSVWALQSLSERLAIVLLPLMSWALAEFFVLKRNMALPAIALLLSFVGGVFSVGMSLFSFLTEAALSASFLMTMVAAWLHWLRFKVPITIAAGSVAIVGFLVSLLLTLTPALTEWALLMVFIGGALAFIFAMYWDASDRTRITHRSDVAFWLHLISAPLIVHPVFYKLGLLSDSASLLSIIIVISSYLFMTLISIVVDRRAFMVSSLAYVLFALSGFFETYGVVSYGLAVTGVCIGSALLLLSAFWHTARGFILEWMPTYIRAYVPMTNHKVSL